jgi:hypothetical protein
MGKTNLGLDVFALTLIALSVGVSGHTRLVIFMYSLGVFSSRVEVYLHTHGYICAHLSFVAFVPISR